MRDLLQESVVQANTPDNAARLSRLERLSDHVYTESLYCFSRTPDIARMQRALPEALADHSGFAAALIRKSTDFLLYRGSGAVAFWVSEKTENCPDFDSVALAAAGEPPATCDPQPLVRLHLIVFGDGRAALALRGIRSRSDARAFQRFMRNWSARYAASDDASVDADTDDDGFATLFGVPVEYESAKNVALVSAKAQRFVRNLGAATAPVANGAIQTADDFIRKIREKYCAQKYAKSGLRVDQSRLLWIKVRRLLETEAPYLDVGFDLKALAARLELTQQILSQVINANAGMNFYELVDSYRIGKAQALLEETGSEQRKLLDIALSSGYACQSTFYAHFKRATGLTPDAYRQLRKQVPAANLERVEAPRELSARLLRPGLTRPD
jgi:AraC-like DNA-binding protein